MKSLEDATHQFKLFYLLTAVKEQKGCIQKAARMIGIHRNSAARIMRQAGYDVKRIRTEARELQN